MISKYIVPALAASNLIGVEAANHHRHLHKKELVYAATEVEVTTEYITVTVTEGDETETSVLPTTVTESSVFAAAATTTSSSTTSTSTSSSIVVPSSTSISSSIVVPSSTSTTPVAVPTTTLATVVSSSSSSAAAPTTTTTSTAGLNLDLGLGLTLGGGLSSTSTSTSTAAAATTSSSSSSSSSGVKRGVAYNTASLVSSILSIAGSSKFSWCYDWGFDSSGLTADIEFIPMLWGPTHYSSEWDTKAEAAITDGVTALFSFNECDNTGQCNLDAATAATDHIKYLNPYEGKILIGAPAISSSETAGQGLDWLASFTTACAGNCAMDFINLHWYGPGGGKGEGGDTFLKYLIKANEQANLPVWVTEFQATSGDEDAFIEYVVHQLDTNSTFDFVHRYSYFYLDTLFSGTSLTTAGTTYATSS
jgi:hypothetical protein